MSGTQSTRQVRHNQPCRRRASDDARAVGRFDPDGPHGYRARSGGPLRATRAEAEADEQRAHAQVEHPVRYESSTPGATCRGFVPSSKEDA